VKQSISHLDVFELIVPEPAPGRKGLSPGRGTRHRHPLHHSGPLDAGKISFAAAPADPAAKVSGDNLIPPRNTCESNSQLTAQVIRTKMDVS
jgi:hypothetical protein